MVPPTIILSSLNVGWPTPTGTLCPSLPHTPTPASSAISLPIIRIRFNASGPLPLSVAPLTGAVILPFSIRYASAAEKTNWPFVISTCPPSKLTAYRPFLPTQSFPPDFDRRSAYRYSSSAVAAACNRIHGAHCRLTAFSSAAHSAYLVNSRSKSRLQSALCIASACLHHRYSARRAGSAACRRQPPSPLSQLSADPCGLKKRRSLYGGNRLQARVPRPHATGRPASPAREQRSWRPQARAALPGCQRNIDRFVHIMREHGITEITVIKASAAARAA